MSSNKKDKASWKANSCSSPVPGSTLSSFSKSKSTRKLPLPEIRIHTDDKPNPQAYDIDEPKAIPWGFGFVSKGTSSTGSSDDDDGTVDDHTLSKTGYMQSGQHQTGVSCYDRVQKSDRCERLLKLCKKQKEEIRRLRVEKCLLEEKFAAYKMANPQALKRNAPRAKVATPKYASPTGPSSPPLEWESSLIIEDGLLEENDPKSVTTAENSASDATIPKERDPHDWRTDYEFFLEQIEQRNSMRIQAETGNPTQSAGGGSSGTTEPVVSPTHSGPPFPKATPLTRPPPSNSAKSPALGGLRKREKDPS